MIRTFNEKQLCENLDEFLEIEPEQINLLSENVQLPIHIDKSTQTTTTTTTISVDKSTFIDTDGDGLILRETIRQERVSYSECVDNIESTDSDEPFYDLQLINDAVNKLFIAFNESPLDLKKIGMNRMHLNSTKNYKNCY